jgi:4-hydroxy-2-oxoglutarate aldolase
LDLSGIYPALVTPFAPDGSVSIANLKHNISRYNHTGLRGFVANGSTGESMLLRREETDGVLVAVKESAASSKQLIAGTGAESTAETIERTKRAAEIGYKWALVKTPHYYKPAYKPEVFVEHYRRVADASPIPVLLYSVPQFTGVALEAKEVAILSEHPNIVGIKESSGNIVRIAEMVATTPETFSVLTGSASSLLPALTMGVRGGILALASAFPEQCVALYDLVRGGKMEQARRLQQTLLLASNLIVAEAGIAGVKFAMDQRGYRGGLPRRPLLPVADAVKARILATVAAIDAIAVPA